MRLLYSTYRGKIMTVVQHDKNLMLVYAVEGYAKKHHITEKKTFDIFKKHKIGKSIRKFYNVLHTQDLDENVFFAEDVIGVVKK